MPASRKEASRDGGSGSISSWGWAARQPNGWRNTFRNTAKKTQRHNYIQHESCAMSGFMHTSFCLEISSMQTAYYVDTFRMIDKHHIYHSHTHIKCIHVVVTTSFPCNNVCSSKMYLSSIQTFAFLSGDLRNFPLSFIRTRPTCSQWFTRQQTWSNNPPNHASPEVKNLHHLKESVFPS